MSVEIGRFAKQLISLAKRSNAAEATHIGHRCKAYDDGEWCVVFTVKRHSLCETDESPPSSREEKEVRNGRAKRK